MWTFDIVRWYGTILRLCNKDKFLERYMDNNHTHRYDCKPLELTRLSACLHVEHNKTVQTAHAHEITS